jgi:hypothetical protein
MRRHARTTLPAAGPLVVALALAAAASVLPASAQQSVNFRLTEWTINAGGDPLNGSSAGSVSWRVSLDALGDTVLGVGQTSVSYRMDVGFVDVYAPPGEVRNQLFSDVSTMIWDPERSAGAYEVYRGLLSGLPGGYGACFQSSLASATATDAGTPPPGSGWFYLVTAKNRLGEEGTKGSDSSGNARPNPAPCP